MKVGKVDWRPAEALELLRELEQLGLPERSFQALHPMRHRIEVYRNYCLERRRFYANSSSHALCDSLATLLAGARSHAPKPIDGTTWSELVAGVLAQARPKSAPAEPYRRLGRSELLVIASQLASLLPVARDPKSNMHRVARWQLRNTLWRCTVDAVRSDGIVEIDAARRSSIWPITRLAAQQPFSERRHEHVVPRVVIAQRLLETCMASADEIYDDIAPYCIAAVVTRAESDLLNRAGYGSAMPPGWRWGDDPWARYKATAWLDGKGSLFDQLVFPPGFSP